MKARLSPGAGEDDVARLVAHVQGTRLRGATGGGDVHDAHAVREVVHHPDFVVVPRCRNSAQGSIPTCTTPDWRQRSRCGSMSKISSWLSGVFTAKSRLPSGVIASGRVCRVSNVRYVLCAVAVAAAREPRGTQRLRCRADAPCKERLSGACGFSMGRSTIVECRMSKSKSKSKSKSNGRVIERATCARIAGTCSGRQFLMNPRAVAPKSLRSACNFARVDGVLVLRRVRSFIGRLHPSPDDSTRRRTG